MKKYKILSLSFLAVAFSAYGQNNEASRFEHKIVAGFNLGATTPLPIPEQVRSINGWWPQFTPQLGYSVLYKVNDKWGVGSGILLNNKGMGVKDRVKYMYTEVRLEENDDKARDLAGYFVGKNETRVKTAYATIPVYVSYRPNQNWAFKLGSYVSYLFSGEFKGEVSDGYLRQDTPVGEKVEITKATFDFNDHLRDFDFGLTVGAERRLNNRFGIYGNLDWGLTSIFPSDFKAVEFSMYNIYLTFGLTYHL